MVDLGGVIIRIHRTWSSACQANGVEVREPVLPRFETPGVQQLVDQYQRSDMDLPTFAAALSGHVDGGYSAAEVEQVHRGWMVGAYDHAEATIRALQAAGHFVGALSNTCAAHWVTMADFGAIRALDHRIGSHEIGHCKPDLRAFAAAESILPDRPGRVVYFDDLPANVAAAAEHGWEAHHVDHAGDPPATIRRVMGVSLGD